jgi:hypothetical protein
MEDIRAVCLQVLGGVRRLPRLTRLTDRSAPTRACWAERQRAGLAVST